MIRFVCALPLFVMLTACASSGPPIPDIPEPVAFPAPVDTLVADEFARCEGIAFNGQGDLYVSGDKALWRVALDGSVERLGTYFSNLGLAAIGERDILFADFGRTSAFNGNPRRDGIVWRVTPEGKRTRLVKKGITDPNFIVVRPDGSFLVSDDSTNEIWHVSTAGELTLFSDAVNCPNGMVVSPDGRTLYVAQIFDGIDPIVWDDRIWKLPLDESGWPAGPPELLAATGEGHDGLAMDVHGRVYTASNHTNQILRIDPSNGEIVVICEGVDGVASLAFGRGEFDHEAIYGTTMRAGFVFSVHVGVEGFELVR
ncbi:MAG: SMP-30/gluconolactonase/LRE family protein [bacterium]|nr:SMP-30/gluconolactonase/LRE family protein [bacterium]